jgi:quercetin dioxygenase-like cupin family protein
MKEKTGTVFSIATDNPPLEGLTISRKVSQDNSIYYFSLGAGTDISPEAYNYNKLILAAGGFFSLYSPAFSKPISNGCAIITPTGLPVGTKTENGAVYVEVELGSDTMINEKVKAGEVFELKNLIPYRKDSIVNIDVLSNSKTKFVVMAFDEGTALSEHAAPGDAIVFALEGKGIIGYEGKEYPIEEGQNFHFAKGGLHSVKANSQFKMALLLSLE